MPFEKSKGFFIINRNSKVLKRLIGISSFDSNFPQPIACNIWDSLD